MSGIFKAVGKVVGDVLGTNSKKKPAPAPAPAPVVAPPPVVTSSAEAINDNTSVGNLQPENSIDPRRKRSRRRQSVLSLENTRTANDRILGN